jgi:hypothetical protein
MKTCVFVRLKRFVLPACFAIACCSFATLASAGTIIGYNAPPSPGLGFAIVPAILSPNEGNDNQTGLPGPAPTDGNQVIVAKRFDNTGYIDIEFFVQDSIPGGATEYKFFEVVDNNTFIDWNSYLIVLGKGVGINFQPSPPGDGLDFDAPTFDLAPTSSAFGFVVPGEDILTFFTGVHSTGSEIYEFRVDVPDGIQSFTLRQYPIPVPEPSTLALAAGALVGFAAMRRRPR